MPHSWRTLSCSCREHVRPAPPNALEEQIRKVWAGEPLWRFDQRSRLPAIALSTATTATTATVSTATTTGTRLLGFRFIDR